MLAKYIRINHKPKQITRSKDSRVATRNKFKNKTCLLCEFEPKSVKDALDNEDWIQAMNEEIDQLEKKKTWTIVHRPRDKNVIGTKWVFRSKLNDHGEVTRNKEY